MEAGNVRDATRRTRLANERTYLAWWRTGLTALAVSFGAGRLLPELSRGPNWPFELVGIAFAVVGIVFMGYGYLRHREVETALDRGRLLGPGGSRRIPSGRSRLPAGYRHSPPRRAEHVRARSR